MTWKERVARRGGGRLVCLLLPAYLTLDGKLKAEMRIKVEIESPEGAGLVGVGFKPATVTHPLTARPALSPVFGTERGTKSSIH